MDSYELLATREREILQPIAEGGANNEIASALNVSPYTVETHRRHILEKLNLHNPRVSVTIPATKTALQQTAGSI